MIGPCWSTDDGNLSQGPLPTPAPEADDRAPADEAEANDGAGAEPEAEQGDETTATPPAEPPTETPTAEPQTATPTADPQTPTATAEPRTPVPTAEPQPPTPTVEPEVTTPDSSLSAARRGKVEDQMMDVTAANGRGRRLTGDLPTSLTSAGLNR